MANKIGYNSSHMECVPLSLELSGGVDLIGHDPGNGLFNILHPFGHLEMPHLIDLFDELVVLLPESHLDLFVCGPLKMKFEMTLEEVCEDEFETDPQMSQRYNLLLGQEYEVSISRKNLGTFFLSIIFLSISMTPLTVQSDRLCEACLAPGHRGGTSPLVPAC